MQNTTQSTEPDAPLTALPKMQLPAVPPNSFENVLKVAAYPTSLVSGYVVAENSIRKGSYKNFARHGVFNEIQAQRTTSFRHLLDDLPSGKAIGNVAREVQRIENIYRAQVKNKFEQMGLHNMVDYWKTLHRDQKIDAFVLGATAAGISIGAMLTIAHEKDWVKSLAHKNSPQEQDGPSV